LSTPIYRIESKLLDDAADESSQDAVAPRLRLLSYNIQTGISTTKYRHYFLHSWKHVLPYPPRLDNLDRIARLVQDYDIVGIQETDAGSLRSSFINQTEYLALQARFPYWYDQTNRSIGRLARHSLGLLSRFRPNQVMEIKLPGMIPGRGALTVRFGRGKDSVVLMIVHLALGKRARMLQMGYIGEILSDYEHVIVMGDMNCASDSPEMNWLLKRTNLQEPEHGLHTFPSWRPSRNIDHILVSPTLEVNEVCVLNYPISDHLPIAMEIALPTGIALIPQTSGADDYEAAAGFV
jgi:endonuclease/exonuclease/phosphatase family metal-dependent hydrolase